jgi:hypothetical protein
MELFVKMIGVTMDKVDKVVAGDVSKSLCAHARVAKNFQDRRVSLFGAIRGVRPLRLAIHPLI